MFLKDLFVKIKENKTLINGSLFSLYSFFGQGVSFVLLIILARYIMPKEYGYLSLFTTVTQVLALLFGLSSSGYVSVVYFKEKRSDFNKDFTAILNVHIVTFLIYLVVLLLGGEYLSKILDLPLTILFIAGVVVIFNKFFGIHQNIHRLKEELKPYGIISCGYALFNFISAIFFVVYLNLNWEGRIYSILLCTSIFAIIALFFFIKDGYFTFSGLKDRYGPILVWSIPLIPHLAANWIKQGLDRYIINYNYSVYEVGIFSFALNLTAIIVSIGVAFNNSNSVALYKIMSSDKSNSDKVKEINKSTKEFLIVFLVISLAVIIGGSILTPFVFPKYSVSVSYFIILGFYGFLQCIYFLYCNFFFYYKKTKNLMYITFFSAIFHLSLSLIFTRYSLYFTAIIYLVSMAVVDFFVIRLSQKLVKQNLNM